MLGYVLEAIGVERQVVRDVDVRELGSEDILLPFLLHHLMVMILMWMVTILMCYHLDRLHDQRLINEREITLEGISTERERDREKIREGERLVSYKPSLGFRGVGLGGSYMKLGNG